MEIAYNIHIKECYQIVTQNYNVIRNNALFHHIDETSNIHPNYGGGHHHPELPAATMTCRIRTCRCRRGEDIPSLANLKSTSIIHQLFI